MEGWKQKVMLEVGHELQAIKMAHAEAMEVQRQGFQLELEKVKEKLGLVESRSETLEEELGLLKALKVAKDERPARSTPMARKVLITNENETTNRS